MILKGEALLDAVIDEFFFYDEAVVHVEDFEQGICSEFKAFYLSPELIYNCLLIRANGLQLYQPTLYKSIQKLGITECILRPLQIHPSHAQILSDLIPQDLQLRIMDLDV